MTVLFAADVLWAVLWRQLSRSGIELPDDVYLGHHVYDLNKTATDRTSAHHQMSAQWSGVRPVFETLNHVFVMRDQTFGFIIPNRCVNANELLAFLESRVDITQLEHKR